MRPSFVLLSALALGAASLPPRVSHAGDQEYPLAFAERPLTLPRLTLAPALEIDIDATGIPFNGTSVFQVIGGTQIGASFGVTPDLELGAVVAPVQFNHAPGYGGVFVGATGDVVQPSVFGTYRLLHASLIELGARLSVQIVVPRASAGFRAGAVFEPSIPVLVRIGKIARLDAAVGGRIAVAEPTLTGSSTQIAGGIDVPLSLSFDVIEPLHLGLRTGFHLDDFAALGATARIPLGVFAGYAIGKGRPIVEIDPFFSFYDFVTPGGGVLGDKVNPRVFVAGVLARGFFYL